MLEKIINSIKTTAKAALVAGTFALSGCYHANVPLYGWNDVEGVNITPRMAVEFPTCCGTDLGDQLQVIPVHPADGGPSQGSVTTDLNIYSGNGADKFASPALSLRAGIEASIKKGYTTYSLGADARLTLFGFYSRVLQDLPSMYESYGYTMLTQRYAAMPFVGISHQFNYDCVIGLEFGFPFCQLDAEAGHYRWDDHDSVIDGSWTGFGRSVTLKIGNSDKYDSGGVSIMYELYKPTFNGADSDVGILTISIRAGLM